jgi:ADP-ribose pyrophosphatase YjhB (NUDIX family)
MSRSPAVRLRGYAYQVFYRLPSRWRRRLVRAGTAKFVVGAVLVVRDTDDRLLLLRQPPGRGWGVPAGLLKRGESAPHGAARELFEETGLRVAPDELQPMQPNALVHTAWRWVDVVFTARVPAGSPLTVDGGEVYEAAFYALDELPTLTPPAARLLGRYGIGPHAAQSPATGDTPASSSEPES